MDPDRADEPEGLMADDDGIENIAAVLEAGRHNRVLRRKWRRYLRMKLPDGPLRDEISHATSSRLCSIALAQGIPLSASAETMSRLLADVRDGEGDVTMEEGAAGQRPAADADAAEQQQGAPQPSEQQPVSPAALQQQLEALQKQLEAQQQEMATLRQQQQQPVPQGQQQQAVEGLGSGASPTPVAASPAGRGIAPLADPERNALVRRQTELRQQADSVNTELRAAREELLQRNVQMVFQHLQVPVSTPFPVEAGPVILSMQKELRVLYRDTALADVPSNAEFMAMMAVQNPSLAAGITNFRLGVQPASEQTSLMVDLVMLRGPVGPGTVAAMAERVEAGRVSEGGKKPRLPEPCKFTGRLDKHVTCVGTWFRVLVSYCAALHLDLVDTLPLFTTGDAQEWVTGYVLDIERAMGQRPTAEELQREFLAAFDDAKKHTAERARERLHASEHNQKPGESVNTYTARFRTIIRDAGKMEELDKIHWYKTGLLPQLYAAVCKDYNMKDWADLDSLVEFTRGAESKDLARKKPTAPVVNAVQTPSPPFRPKRTFVQRRGNGNGGRGNGGNGGNGNGGRGNGGRGNGGARRARQDNAGGPCQGCGQAWEPNHHLKCDAYRAWKLAKLEKN